MKSINNQIEFFKYFHRFRRRCLFVQIREREKTINSGWIHWVFMMSILRCQIFWLRCLKTSSAILRIQICQECSVLSIIIINEIFQHNLDKNINGKMKMKYICCMYYIFKISAILISLNLNLAKSSLIRLQNFLMIKQKSYLLLLTSVVILSSRVPVGPLS